MENDYKVIARSTYPAEAIVIKGKLESEGIVVNMLDYHTINTDPLLSNAIGGVKLVVKQKDVPQAISILNAISEYSLTDNGTLVTCPQCHAEKTVFTTTVNSFKAFVAWFVGLVLGALPWHTKYEYRCTSCHHNFNTA
ncbi:Hypothetical protein I595_1315 [Croceitalea dokdonensis DOKDO 023]|uniref:DUF2007 domain-containing protein n=1 Tax=Croceitalea dokdonensis DOKDO 023 TaxID=1300341 RepID=A0A0P7AXI4_9FLAO|nr:hypothetical protein [Croceitalea dokdonensis]KPM32888.1 Hypothetical protein I595_1315 [Croceitalea dokdonensis DOKDO 023]